MEGFTERKEHALKQMTTRDRSKKGSVDEHIKDLLDAINEHESYYTTSSCAGRIVALHEPESEKKNEYDWLYTTHEPADPARVWEAVREPPATGRVWLRMQPPIIHVASKDLAAANRLLARFYKHGWKRSGIFSTKNDVMLELLSVEGVDAPVAENGKLLVDEEYVENAIGLCNEKLCRAHEKIAAAEQRVRRLHFK